MLMAEKVEPVAAHMNDMIQIVIKSNVLFE